MSLDPNKITRRDLPCSCKPGEQCQVCIAFKAARREERRKVRNKLNSEALQEKLKEIRLKARIRSQEKYNKLGIKSKEPKPPVPSEGPGTEFKILAESLGQSETNICSCERIKNLMNRLGVKGCQEKFDEIVQAIKVNKSSYGFFDHLKAGLLAVKEGLVFSINPLDPIPDLVTEAIRRAASKEATSLQP